MSEGPRITAFFDEATNSVSYLVADPLSGVAAAIDPVLDFDAASGRIATLSADRMIAAAEEQGAKIQWVLETHAHADHLTAADLIRRRTGAKVGAGAGMREVQRRFGPLLCAEDIAADAFDRLFEDGETMQIGGHEIRVMATPGHTPSCVTYLIGDAVFVGDTLFMPDYGTARCDFPGGNAKQLYASIQRILALPEQTRLFLCHDYKAPGREAFAWETTGGEQRRRTGHIGGGKCETEYVAMREARDATLNVPKLLYPAIQVNIRGGRLPPADARDRRFLTIPLTLPPEV
jgi:glyoxylase-like metal-dependent hydrolase (beta-lactamase superfamily II)